MSCRLFDDLAPPLAPPDTPKKALLARLLPRSLKALKGRREVQNVLAPLYNLQYTPGAKVRRWGDWGEGDHFTINYLSEN